MFLNLPVAILKVQEKLNRWERVGKKGTGLVLGLTSLSPVGNLQHPSTSSDPFMDLP